MYFNKSYIYLLLSFTSFVWWSCEDIAVEDLPPLVLETTSLISGDTLTQETISITLNSEGLASEYRYMFDSDPWSDWSSGNVIVLEYLDEGAHELQLQALRTSSNDSTDLSDTSDIQMISFFVDAVEGPSLMFYPRRHKAQSGEQVTFLIHAEEVENLMAAEIHLEFDTTAISINAVIQGSFFINDQESIFSYDIGEGTISILTSVVNSDAPSVSGTGVLADIQVTLLGSSDATISFSGNEVFRDPDNNDVVILEKVNGLITVE